jgi:predicted secreted hydrolase
MLSYDIQKPQLRTPSEEWQPHAIQSRSSTEWWYLTSLVFDPVGNPYFLVSCLFHLGGEDVHGGRMRVPDGHRLVAAMFGITDYTNDHRLGDTPGAVMPERDTWDEARNAVRFDLGDWAGLWSFNGDTMHAALKSANLSFDLRLVGASQIMYAKDKLGVEGFIQEGAPEDRSYYYSLPRMTVSGRVTYTDKAGARRDIDVSGSGWVDRQWGDFLTKSWEWSSLRFSNGARVNLYNFANGHQVGTYQKPDGTTEWFDGFEVRQNGYVKAPNGIWMSWGWSYDFPIDIEGSRNYTLNPFSRKDIYVHPLNTLFEGPSHLVNDRTGEIVGIAVTESMDVRIMDNAPGGANQR